MFFLFLLVPVLRQALVALRGVKKPAIVFPGASFLKTINPSPRARLRMLPEYLKYAAFFLLIVALARPQTGHRSEEILNHGIDIMLALDTSTSMRALDFKPSNRFDAAQKLAREFVKGRRYDRAGIVVFSGLAFTQCPLTTDLGAVTDFLDQCSIGMTGLDGTAVGSAIATAANRLKGGTGKSRVIILLTDGRNNSGEIDPVTAAEAAASLGIKIYAIGAGKPGGALYPVDDPVWGRRLVTLPEEDLDEPTLTKIAESTGGKYFRATDSESLSSIFRQIDSMEKTEIKTLSHTRYTELYRYFLLPAFVLLALGLLMRLWLRKLP